MSEKKIRQGHRLHVNTLINTLRDVVGRTNIRKIDLEVPMNLLNKQMIKIEVLDAAVIEPLEGDELRKEMEGSFKIAGEVENILYIAEAKLKEIARTPTVSSPAMVVKLPTINLPHFNGSALEWATFWDTFKGAVHDRVDMTKAQKFSYLKGQLKGEAADILKGFTVTDTHYDEAVNLLKEKYGKTNRIVQAHLHALLDLQCVDSSFKELNKFRTSFESHLRGLEAMKQKVNDAGYVLVAILLRKLPGKINENMNRASTSDEWTLDEFRKAIEREVSLLENLEVQDSSNEFASRSAFKETETDRISTAGTFSVTSTNRTKVACGFCGAEHRTITCEKFKKPEERRNKAKENRLCFNCLATGHPAFSCRSKGRCSKCRKRHHTLLCLPPDKQQSGTLNVNVNEVVTGAATLCINLSKKVEVGVALPTACVPVKNNNTIVFRRALFDQGAQKSFVLRSTMQQLQLQIVKTVNMCVDAFRHDGTVESFDMVEIRFQDRAPLEAFVVDVLPSKICMPGIHKWSKYLKGKGIKLGDSVPSNDCIEDIEILIGGDQMYNYIGSLIKYEDICLLTSCFGMLITGPLPSIVGSSSGVLDNRTKILSIFGEADLREDIFSLDSIGLQPLQESLTDKKVHNEFIKNIVYDKGHYRVSLPWKGNREDLKSNFGMALGRLNSTLRQLQQKPDMLKMYDSIFQDYVSNNFIEVVSEKKRKYNVHYLSHHGVRKDSTTTPLRVVFDCSAGVPSLNQCLQTGPCLINDLCQVIMRFRINKFASVGDISKAFLRIELEENDRDYTRFLWKENPFNENSKTVIFRFRVVLFGATCSPFLLNATILHHLERTGTQIAGSVRRNIYVDNLQITLNTEEKMVETYQEAKKVFGSANLDLLEWETNSPALKKIIMENGDVRKGSSSTIKILGVSWHISEDFLFAAGIATEIRREDFTKRNVSKSIAKIFDPLGFLSPITIRAKLFYQEMWKQKLSWDEVIPCEKTYKTFSKLVVDLNKAVKIGIPRQINSGRVVSFHIFCDASAKACGAVVYAVSGSRSMIVGARAKVSSKELSIPKLELAAATVGVRLAKFVKDAYSEELEVESTNYWSDSKVTLCWIATNKELKVYERNRVDEIRGFSDVKEWRYVPTSQNPADLLSRGMPSDRLAESGFWFHGPDWLPHISNWPAEYIFACDIGRVPTNAGYVTLAASVLVKEPVFDPHRVGSWKKLIRVTAYIMKWFYLRSEERKTHGSPTLTDIEKAEKYWIMQEQERVYCSELQYLKKNLPVSTPPNLVGQLGLFLEDSLIRCKGRIQYSNVSMAEKFPILIPHQGYITELIVRNFHENLHHAGTSSVVSSIRQRFWIPRTRQVVKAVIRPCVVCKRIQGRSFPAPPIPPLPEIRIGESRPFSVTGVDYTGALNVKNGSEIIKSYIVLFTCAVTRAIHLEVVEDNSKDSFLLAFRRFVGRRACPRYMVSDNAKTFVSSAPFLKKLFDDQQVQEEFTMRACEWKFLPSRAPWFGGFFERLIGLTKNSLRKILGKALVSLDELRTLIVEIEGTLNDRPITYASTDLNDPSALTPSKLLHGYCLGSLPDSVPDPDPEFGAAPALSARQIYYERLRRDYWKRWRMEYLLSLRERSNQLGSGKPKGRAVATGDIVIIHEEFTPRLCWKLGRVLQLFISDDDVVRSVELLTKNGKITRPVTKLYPLEVQCETSEKNEDIIEEKPKRIAAEKAREAIKNIVDYESNY